MAVYSAGDIIIPKEFVATAITITGSTYTCTGSRLTSDHRIIFLTETGSKLYIPCWHLNG